MNEPHEDEQPREDPRVARTRALILAAARQLLLDEGQEAVTPTRLAAITGVARSTIYRHWRDPAEIVFEATATDTGAPTLVPSGDVRGDLIAYLEELRSMLGTTQATLGATQIDRAEHSPAAGEVLGRIADARLEMIARLVHEDPEQFSDRHALLVGPLFFQRYLGRRPVTDELIELVADAYLRTLPSTD